MREHSRPKDGVLSHAYDPRIQKMNRFKFDGMPGQVYDRAALRADPVARQ
jgi:hypothetical protein